MGRGLGVGVGLGVFVGVGVEVGVGVGVGGGPAQYLPPVFKKLPLPNPPQTIISLPVQTAVCKYRASGALVVLVAVHVSRVHGSISGRV